MAKIAGAIGVCLIYQFYYEGGDTVNYFLTSKAIGNLYWKDSEAFFNIMLGEKLKESFMAFDLSTGWSYFRSDDIHAIRTCTFMVPFAIISFNSYVVASILLAWLCYSGVWRLFLLFCNQFPHLQKQISISILFIPSVVFWGSGFLKDTITFSAVGWFSYSFFQFFIQKKYSVSIAINIFISIFFLIAIKPYIFFALVPGSIIWGLNEKIARIRSKFFKAIAAPLVMVAGILLGILILGQMGDMLGAYSIDKVLDKAVESNFDQKQDYYGGNSFDIGEFDATLTGVMSKAHLAISATLFRPFIFEARNPVMFLAGLENTYILLLTLLLLFRLKFFGFFSLIGKHPLLTFSMLFALFFAFSVGLATSNFGTLVRLKIPCIPFFVSSLFVMRHFYEKQSKKKLRF